MDDHLKILIIVHEETKINCPSSLVLTSQITKSIKMWRQVMLSIWILLMISSINPLSPAEKLITSGSPGLSSSQNTEDLLLMSSAKKLLAEFQDQDEFHDEESQSLSRKKRSGGFGLGYSALPPKTDRPVNSKRFSNFKVDSAPLASASVAITKDDYEVLDRFMI